MPRQFLLLLTLFSLAGCAALPFAAPTADAPATETRIAGNIFATQTANAPTPDPRVTETAIAAKIFATQTASAPTATNASSAQTPSITCSFLLPSELPNFFSHHTAIYASLQEWEQDTHPASPPTTPWLDWLKQSDVKSICYNGFQGMTTYPNSNLLPAAGTFQMTFSTAADAHTIFEQIETEFPGQSTILTTIGDESNAFVAYQERDQGVSYEIIFRKKNTLVLVSLRGPIDSTPSSEIVRIAKVMETKIP